MAKLYYGNGTCTIEGSNIRGAEIRYRGRIEIEDKTSASFALATNNNKILIFPIGKGTLNELFDYHGEIKIISALVSDNNGERVSTTIHRVMDYSELLNTNAEDMTVKSEDLNAGHTSGRRVNKTSIKVKIIPNQNTSDVGSLYLKDGTLYSGAFHIHLDTGGAMTGGEHTKDSQDLYFMRKDKLIATKNFKPKQKTSRVTRKTRGRTSGGGY
jgi:hypothetical protein